MKCPKCEYERQPNDDAPDYECPACGVVYAKFIAARAKVQRDMELEEQSRAEAAIETPKVDREQRDMSRLAQCEDCGGTVSRRAVSCVHCGRPFGGEEDARSAPVAVIDVRMKFWSMVVFMVKWAIAVIPAAIILAIFFSMLVAAVGGFLVGSR